MIWGYISRNDCSELKIYETGVHVNGKLYERLLRERLQSEMLQHQADIFMHDNAPCHRASRVSRFLWESVITPEYCKKLVVSMRDRIAKVIKNRRGPTKF